VDGNGIIRRFLLSPGQRHDAPFALHLLESVDLHDAFVLGDRGYDSDIIVQHILDNKGIAVIPSKANRCFIRSHDTVMYKLRNIIERFFNRLKHFRRVAIRFDKLASSFSATLLIAAIRIFLRLFLGHDLGNQKNITRSKYPK